MTNPTDDQLNRKCAERLGWHVEPCDFPISRKLVIPMFALMYPQGCAETYRKIEADAWAHVPDFLRDPAANEMLLEALRKDHFEKLARCNSSDEWGDHGWFALKRLFKELLTTRIDTKRAIVLAFLAS